MSAACPDPIADSRRIETEILRRLATVKNDHLAHAVGREASWVSKLVSGETGLRLAQLQPFLDALGLKLVAANAISVDPEIYAAYRTLAKAAMLADEGGEGA